MGISNTQILNFMSLQMQFIGTFSYLVSFHEWIWRAESNSITRLGYKAGMFIWPAGCKGDHPTKLAHQQAKMLQICKPSPYILSRILGTHLHIHYPSRNSFTYCPSPGTCVVRSRCLPLVVVGMKSEAFLGLTLQCIQTGQSHSFCIVPFFVFPQLTMKCWDVVLLP